MKITNLLTISLITAGILAISAMPVMADGQTQETITETVCETTSYGQENCREVKTIKGLERVEKPAEVLNTGLDVSSLMASTGLISAGLVALKLKRSSK